MTRNGRMLGLALLCLTLVFSVGLVWWRLS